MSCPTCDHTMKCLAVTGGDNPYWCPRCGTVKYGNHEGDTGEKPKIVELADSIAWYAVHQIDDDACDEVRAAMAVLECTQPPDGMPS